ncbi:MFS transporter [Actinocrispum wychmicini]|uniref:MFS transporter n=1 Tax=Actinocrispum wychmicini TaxID=1213861 RepID=UPI00140433F9|nr:MFS transporter [Actinocrispum wychmicini]
MRRRFTRNLPSGQGVAWFGTAGFANAVGTGIYYPYQLLFFREVLGIPLTTVGVGLTASILVTLPAVVYIGRLVDRYGSRPMLIAASLGRAGAFVGFVVGHGAVLFVALAMLLAICFRADQVASQVLAASAAPRGQSAQWLALTRIVFNAGVGLGAVVAGVALVGGPATYSVLGLAAAACYLVAALCYLPLPVGSRRPVRAAGDPTRPWRHRIYVRLASTHFVMFTALVATEAALPVYLIDNLGWPAWMVGATLAINIVLLVVLQLPVSKVVQRYSPLPVLGLGAALHGALFFALAVAAGPPGATQVVVFLVGMIIYTVGETTASQVLMVLLVHVAPEAERGAYQAFSQTLTGIALGIAPLFVTVLLALSASAVWWTLFGAVLMVGVSMTLLHRRNLPAIRAAWAAQLG